MWKSEADSPCEGDEVENVVCHNEDTSEQWLDIQDL